jgi:hypothetical protein
MTHIITATFKTRVAAEEALEALEQAGFTEEQISLLVSDDTRGKNFRIKEGSKADEGAAAGATFGGVVGAILAGVAAAGTLVIPGLNLVVSGALVGALAGLGAGAATGGLVGALVGAGIPEHEARLYENELATGSILIAVEADTKERRDAVEDILKRVDAYNVAA